MSIVNPHNADTFEHALFEGAAKVRLAGLENVATLIAALMVRGTAKSTLADMVRIQLSADCKSSTVYRHIGYAAGVIRHMKAKMPDHARIGEFRAANSVTAKVAAVSGFLADMGISLAGDCELWAKGDGTPLTSEQRDTIRAEKAEKEKVKKAAGGKDAPLVPEAVTVQPEPAAPAPAPAPAPIGVESMAAVLAANIGAISDATLAQLTAAINAERKARKAAKAQAQAEAA